MKPGMRFTAGVLRPERASALTLLLHLGLLHGMLAHAVLPAMPPPCLKSYDSEPVASLLQRIEKNAAGGTWQSRNEADCASQALARKGPKIIPPLLSLLDRQHQSDVERDALGAICGLGSSGAKAVPYIVERLRAGDSSSFAEQAYPTLACVGKGAQPAIPLLIEKSMSDESGYFTESREAIETLGSLAQYAPHTIIPHLIRLLEKPDHIVTAAEALEHVGPLAGAAAAEPLRRHLSVAVSAGQDFVAASLVAALVAVHETKPAVATLSEMLHDSHASIAAARALGSFRSEAEAAIPALIDRLNAPDASWKEQDGDVAALIAIDEPSPAVLTAVIVYVTRDGNWKSRYEAASSLARVNPFPGSVASTLAAAITRLPEDDLIRGRLEEALEHADARIKPSVERAPPVDLSAQLRAGLLALTQQPHAVNVSDVASQLRFAPRDYVQEEGKSDVTLSGKRDWARSTTGASPVISVHVEEVQQAQQLLGDPTLPFRQKIEIYLADGACVSMDAIRPEKTAPEPTSADLPTIEIVASHWGSGARLVVDGDRSADKSEARESVLEIESGCAGHIRIEKSFDTGYWSAACPFSADDHFVRTVIIPAVRELLGSEAEMYDVGSPQIHDFGQATVQLGYDPVRPAAPGQDWQPARLWLAMDRCSHKVSLISKSLL